MPASDVPLHSIVPSTVAEKSNTIINKHFNQYSDLFSAFVLFHSYSDAFLHAVAKASIWRLATLYSHSKPIFSSLFLPYRMYVVSVPIYLSVFLFPILYNMTLFDGVSSGGDKQVKSDSSTDNWRDCPLTGVFELFLFTLLSSPLVKIPCFLFPFQKKNLKRSNAWGVRWTTTQDDDGVQQAVALFPHSVLTHEKSMKQDERSFFHPYFLWSSLFSLEQAVGLDRDICALHVISRDS